MKILITGAKGQLGREICECFKRGYTELGSIDVLKKDNEIYPNCLFFRLGEAIFVDYTKCSHIRITK